MTLQIPHQGHRPTKARSETSPPHPSRLHGISSPPSHTHGPEVPLWGPNGWIVSQSWVSDLSTGQLEAAADGASPPPSTFSLYLGTTFFFSAICCLWLEFLPSLSCSSQFSPAVFSADIRTQISGSVQLYRNTQGERNLPTDAPLLLSFRFWVHVGKDLGFVGDQ